MAWLGLSGPLDHGVPTEPSVFTNYRRLSITAPSGPGWAGLPNLSFGPARGSWPLITQFVVMSLVTEGVALFTAPITAVRVPIGGVFSYRAGVVNWAAAAAYDAGVLTLNGVPLEMTGLPLRIGP